MTGGIYSLGNAIVDTEVYLSSDQLNTLGVEKGVMQLADEARFEELVSKAEHWFDSDYCGGSSANSLVTARGFGVPCTFSFAVSDDEYGRLYTEDLKRRGVCPLPFFIKGRTGRSLVFITECGERSMVTHLGVTENLLETYVSEKSIQKSDFVYIEGYLLFSDLSYLSVKKVIALANKYKKKVAISLSDPSVATFCKERILESIYLASDGILFCNRDELMLLTQIKSLDKALDTLSEKGFVFCVTMGADGAIGCDLEGQYRVRIPANTTVVDTTGAGDCFSGVFLSMLVKGYGFFEALNFSVIVASRLVEVRGPRLKEADFDYLTQYMGRCV